VTHDDPFIVRMNIARFQSLLQAEIDEPTRQIVRQILAEFEAPASKRQAPPDQPSA
jgi:hypothetical protein